MNESSIIAEIESLQSQVNSLKEIAFELKGIIQALVSHLTEGEPGPEFTASLN